MMSEANNGLDSFANTVQGIRAGIKRQYDRSVNKDLAQQNSQDLFSRNVSAVLQQVYQQALTQLQQMSFADLGLETEGGSRALAGRVFKPFDGMIEELLQYALQKHRSSCALSNFPAEHNPSPEYLEQVIAAASRDWSAFASQVTALIRP
jgi:hypothetical protein